MGDFDEIKELVDRKRSRYNSNMTVLKVQEQIMFELYTCEKNGRPNSLNDYRSARVFY